MGACNICKIEYVPCVHQVLCNFRALGKRGKGKKKKGRGTGGQSKDDMDLELESAAMRYIGHGGSSDKRGKTLKKGGKKDHFKTLSPATLRAIEHTMGLRWNPAEMSLNLSSFLDTPEFASVEGEHIHLTDDTNSFLGVLIRCLPIPFRSMALHVSRSELSVVSFRARKEKKP